MSSKTTFICDVTGASAEGTPNRPDEAPEDFDAPLGWAEITFRSIQPNPRWPEILRRREFLTAEAEANKERETPGIPFTEAEHEQIDALIEQNTPGEPTIYVEAVVHVNAAQAAKLAEKFSIALGGDA